MTTGRVKGLRIGFAFNLKPAGPRPSVNGHRGREMSTHSPVPAESAAAAEDLSALPPDTYAEWDDEATIDAVEDVLASLGDVIRLEADADFPTRLRSARPDIVFNIAEGFGGPSREAYVPAFCEFWGIPYTGSDPATLAICLDKARTKEILLQNGIATPEFRVARNRRDLDGWIALPAIVKPLHEGSSMGVTQRSICSTRGELHAAVTRTVARYAEPAIVERFLDGREFTVAILGNGESVRILPIVELDLGALPPGARPIYGYEAKWIWDRPERPLDIFDCPAALSSDLQDRIETLALRTFRALRCRDWARVDIRCAANGTPHVLEINPLPGMLPDPSANSCFPKAARAAGLSYTDLIRTVVQAAATRHGLNVAV